MRIKPGRGLLGARGRPPGKGSRPLAPANSKEGTLGKRVRRGALSVQLAFRAANRSRVQLVLGAFATVAFILIMIALLPASPLFSPGTCACPATAMARTRLLALAKTALVARIGAAGELNPIAMLLGPPGLLRHPLALAPADVSGCGELPAGSLALVLLGDTVRSADANASAPAAPLLGCAQATVFPWSEWADAARHFAASNDGWWRAPAVRALWEDGKTTSARATAKKPPLPRAEWWVRPGVSVIAACMDRPDTLAKASASWFTAHGVDEVVLVDWSSASHAITALPVSALSDPRLVAARVEGEGEWALARAYNLALALSSRETILKVDCDTRLRADFIRRHDLRGGDFYAGDWRALNPLLTKNQLHVNGLLLARRDDILAVGGYDERIATYGWDDSDVAQRLSATRKYRRFDYSDVEHIVHPASLRVARQASSALLPHAHPQAAAVEIQRNRLLLTRFGLQPWQAAAPRTVWDIELRSSADSQAGAGVFGRAAGVVPIAPGGPAVFVATAATKVPAANEMVSEEQSVDAAIRAMRIVLMRYGFPPSVPKSLSLPFLRGLLTKVSYPERFADTSIALRGGCMARLLGHSATLAVTSGGEGAEVVSNEALFSKSAAPPPEGYSGWRARLLWKAPDEECGCKFNDAFLPFRAEISSTWAYPDEEPHFRAYQAGVLPSDVEGVLASFDKQAVTKKASHAPGLWPGQPTNDTTRALFAQLSCDIPPPKGSAWHTLAVRTVLRELRPREPVRNALAASFGTQIKTLLDSPLLHATAWPVLVGQAATTQVLNMFKDPLVLDLNRVWGAAGAEGALVPNALEQRAAALVVGMRIAREENWRGRLADLGEARVRSIGMVVDELDKRFKRLFAGCPDNAAAYLDEYPELAMVAAGLLSANYCMN